jgi:hypothetical protein
MNLRLLTISLSAITASAALPEISVSAARNETNSVTTPRGVITRFSRFPALVNGEIVPFGKFTFIRLG